ncbi:MAG: L,D-transpeptidase family protein [Syntrophales bacterium]|nr:L,D-transpeptidase family protein [Syntrophales bacterium]
MVVEKALRRLTILQNGQSIKTYTVALGKNSLGPKTRKGDGRTPEGVYVIDKKNAKSKFHLALHISYPDIDDKARAKSLGVPPGDGIMIHGIKDRLSWIGSRHIVEDWTQGCIAVTNSEIEEIWKMVPRGTVIEILP